MSDLRRHLQNETSHELWRAMMSGRESLCLLMYPTLVSASHRFPSEQHRPILVRHELSDLDGYQLAKQPTTAMRTEFHYFRCSGTVVLQLLRRTSAAGDECIFPLKGSRVSAEVSSHFMYFFDGKYVCRAGVSGSWYLRQIST